MKYIDYSKDVIPMTNAFNYFMHKRIYFKDEQELRAVSTNWDPEHDSEIWNQVWREVDIGRFPGLRPYNNVLKKGKTIGFSPDEYEEADQFRAMLEEAKLEITREKNPPGLEVKVNLYELIEAIYVNPNCESWFVDVVKRLVRYMLNPDIQVFRSGLDKPV